MASRRCSSRCRSCGPARSSGASRSRVSPNGCRPRRPRLAGLDRRKGAIAAGCDADLVIVDPDREVTVEASRLYHRHPVTPYDGARLQRRGQTTMLRGEIVYDHSDVRRRAGARRRCPDPEMSAITTHVLETAQAARPRAFAVLLERRARRRVAGDQPWPNRGDGRLPACIPRASPLAPACIASHSTREGISNHKVWRRFIRKSCGVRDGAWRKPLPRAAVARSVWLYDLSGDLMD